MLIQHLEFKGSFPSLEQCPKDNKPEYAFIGRSNVGKSSLINMLVGRKGLARTSGKPGKTQTLNFFLVDNEWYLVDLPGYGYARISKRKRVEWEKLIQNYLVNRPTLQCAFVLIDANVPPQLLDVEFINWLGQMHIPFVLVYTKADRLKEEELQTNIRNIQQELLQYWHTLPQEFVTSANTKKGREELLQFIEEVNARVA